MDEKAWQVQGLPGGIVSAGCSRFQVQGFRITSDSPVAAVFLVSYRPLSAAAIMPERASSFHRR
jgi:hypothetical protein